MGDLFLEMQPKNKHLLVRYFTFTAVERRAVYLLIILSLLFFVIPYLYPWFVKPSGESAKPVDRRAAPEYPKTAESVSDPNKSPSQNAGTTGKAALFYFDPNQATEEEWIRLGVRAKTAATIIRYRMKGGRFTVPDDIKKIWGLSPEKADQLIPYVRIRQLHLTNEIQRRPEGLDKKIPSKDIIIDINSATQQEWERLHGIGPATAARIIQFRAKLGGFLSVHQVGETYGIKDSIFQKIRPQLYFRENSFQRIPLNRCTEEELSRHPYIHYRTAKAIISYRGQNGTFKHVSDLQKIESIDLETYRKIEPYCIAD